MAYVEVALTAAEVAGLNDDKTLIGAQNGNGVNQITPEWSDGGSWVGNIDITETGFPTPRTFDNFSDLRTKPDATKTDVFILYDFGSAGIDIDFVAQIGHNAADGTTVTYDLQIADDNAFSTNLLTIGAFSPSNNDRLIDITLQGGNKRYTGVQYARIRIQSATLYTPEIGEIIWGRRTQLAQNPNRPYNPDMVTNENAVVTSRGGPVAKFSFGRGRRLLEASTIIVDNTEVQDIKDFWDRIKQGGENFVWIDAPSANPNGWVWFVIPKDVTELELDDIGPRNRQWNIAAIEQGPEFIKIQ